MIDIVYLVIFLLSIAALLVYVIKSQGYGDYHFLGTVALFLWLLFLTLMVHKKLDIIVKLFEK